MPITNEQATAINHLILHITDVPTRTTGKPPTREQFAAALELLAGAAYKKLSAGVTPDMARERLERMERTSSASPERPFDPELPKRLQYLLAAIAAAPQCSDLDDDHIWVFEHGDQHISLAEMTQLLHRLAYAERTRAELADKCADYRAQLDDARSKHAAGATSPTTAVRLGAWLRALPDRTILRSEAGNAWQLDHGIESGAGAPRKFRALVPALGEMPFEITDGHPDLEPLVEIGPFTILAIGTPGSEDD